jgi:hypothetical protein
LIRDELNPSVLPSVEVFTSRPYRIIEKASVSMARKIPRYLASRKPRTVVLQRINGSRQ